MQFKNLSVVDSEGFVHTLPSQDLLQLHVKIAHAQHVRFLEVVVNLACHVEVRLDTIPKLQSVTFLHQREAGTLACFRELEMTLGALSLEKWVDLLALLACFPLTGHKLKL